MLCAVRCCAFGWFLRNGRCAWHRSGGRGLLACACGGRGLPGKACRSHPASTNVQRVLETSEPPGLSRWLRSRAYSLGHRLRALAGADWGPAFWSNMQRLHWDCPMLFLYSADDVLCDGAKVGASGCPVGEWGWVG